jgi:Arc/MetJ-type ribon-helix-helix transcriptional regulator
MIDLDTLEGWYEFQGWPEGVERPPAAAHGEHWTEAPTASILVELARIHLRNPLLDLTTVADTPGTGSGNNGHDSITARYLSQAEGFILLLPTDRVHHGGVREIIERLREQLDDRYHGSPALGLASVAFVVNCFPTHGKQAQLEAIEKFQRMICDTFFEGKTEDWRRRQRDPRTRNFFVVRLKGLEEGERSETLHNHPSLIPLREWIENLFRSGRYSERFNFIRNALTTDWMRAYQLLKKQQAQELQSDRDREKRITAIQAFIEDELESLAQEHLTNINDFRRGFTGLCDDVTRLMEGYSGNQVKLKPDDLRQWQRGVQTYYADVNERLERFLSWEVAESWIEEMKARLHALGVTPPPLSAPVPAEQTLPWDESYHLEITTMNRMFNEMIEGWPQGLSRVGQWFKRTFTSEDDTRVTLVRNLIAFWKREYADLWDDRLKTYLRRCEQCIKQGSLQVKRRCEEAIEAAQDTTASAARLEAIQTAIACFDGFNAERQRLLDALEKELDRGN